MDKSNYITLGRQSGLMQEMRSVANNLANVSTTAYKRESAIFTEYVTSLENNSPSISMSRLGAHYTDFSQGGQKQTGAPLDIAIAGDGFFSLNTPLGIRLTRAGHFIIDQEQRLVTTEGYAVLDETGGEIALPAGAADIAIASDGTMSAAGTPFARLGIVSAAPEKLTRDGDRLWRPLDGYEPAQDVRIQQGALEQSNVNPVLEISRLIEVQRSYEAGQFLLDRDDDRLRKVIEAIEQLR